MNSPDPFCDDDFGSYVDKTRLSNGDETIYVYCVHGAWSSVALAKKMHEIQPDMPRGRYGPQA